MHRVYLSSSVNPFFNLALEEYMVSNHNPADEILLLWQNQKTVVIGRNQNPWKECNLEKLNEQKSHLVRRLSGGGAVYHDMGNLNFTYISAYSEGRVTQNIDSVIRTLALNGIKAEFSGKNDILVQGYKVSGNAFFQMGHALCHHGTLLVHTDLAAMESILTVSQKKLASKGIDSIKSRVRNLEAIEQSVSIKNLKTSLINNFLSAGNSIQADGIYTVSEYETEDIRLELLPIFDLMKKYASWEWNFGSTPEFNLQISEQFDWGGVDLYLIIKEGIVTEARMNTDALNVALPQLIRDKLINMKYDYEGILNHLRSY